VKPRVVGYTERVIFGAFGVETVVTAGPTVTLALATLLVSARLVAEMVTIVSLVTVFGA
jgi:hypothetical protein